MARLQSGSVQKRQLKVCTGLRANMLAILAAVLGESVMVRNGTMTIKLARKIRLLTCFEFA